MASALAKAWAAMRLRVLASGAVDLASDETLTRVVELVAEFSPAERAEVAEQAVSLGADPALIQSLLNLAGGEVIQVSGRVRKPRRWWPWLLGAVVAAGAGGYAIHRRRRRRGRLTTGS